MNHNLILQDEIAFWKENLIKVDTKYDIMYIELNLPDNFKMDIEQIKSLMENPEITANRDSFQGIPLRTFTTILKGSVKSAELKLFIESLCKNPEEKRGIEIFWSDGTPYVPTKRPK